MLRIPYSILMGLIIIFASVGAYSVNNNVFDVWMMLGLGVLGYVMKKLKYPIVPLILAMVWASSPRTPSPGAADNRGTLRNLQSEADHPGILIARSAPLHLPLRTA